MLRPVRLYALRDLPFPHTFRDERITEYMTAHYESDGAGPGNCFQVAHEIAYREGHPGYLAMMRESLNRFKNIGRVCARAVELVREHGDEVSDVIREQMPQDRLMLEWLSWFPINFIPRELGDGQHRVSALRIFCGPDAVVPAVARVPSVSRRVQ